MYVRGRVNADVRGRVNAEREFMSVRESVCVFNITFHIEPGDMSTTAANGFRISFHISTHTHTHSHTYTQHIHTTSGSAWSLETCPQLSRSHTYTHTYNISFHMEPGDMSTTVKNGATIASAWQDFGSSLENMSRAGKQGDWVTLQAAAHMLQSKFTVVFNSGGRPKIHFSPGTSDPTGHFVLACVFEDQGMLFIPFDPDLQEDESAWVDPQNDDDQEDSSEEEVEEGTQQTATMKPMECKDCGTTR